MDYSRNVWHTIGSRFVWLYDYQQWKVSRINGGWVNTVRVVSPKHNLFAAFVLFFPLSGGLPLPLQQNSETDYKHKNISLYLGKISLECIKYIAISMYCAHQFIWFQDIYFFIHFLSGYLYLYHVWLCLRVYLCGFHSICRHFYRFHLCDVILKAFFHSSCSVRYHWLHRPYAHF